MKKALVGMFLFFSMGLAMAQFNPQCKQVYVCGGGGCQWVVVCR